jgi:alkanesulfonate monooxygenase
VVELYATCPPSIATRAADYRRLLTDVARRADVAGCTGLLVFTDNNTVDPWVVAHRLIEQTERLVPLVAAQPPFLHPYTLARTISSIAFLSDRRVDLNLVTGGNQHHIRAAGDPLDHDTRYDRLVEFGTLIGRLLTERRPVTHQGRYYDVAGARVRPLRADLMPRIFLAGSSTAAQKAERALGAVRLSYPREISEYDAENVSMLGTGMRIGIIARETSGAAWKIAHRLFPPDSNGEDAHDIARTVTESQWFHRLAHDADRPLDPGSTYWLHPFRSFQEYCPFLVGSYEEVADPLARYLRLGVTTIIVGVPHDDDDLHHVQVAVRRAEKLALARS